MSKKRMTTVRNIIVAVFSIYFVLLVMDRFFFSIFYVSLFINFSNRYLLFALAYFLISINLKDHLEQTRAFLFLFVALFLLTLSPIYFYIYDIKEFDLNDPLSSLTYINLALHLLSVYTIYFSIKMINRLNSTKMNKKKFFYIPHIIYMTLIILYILVDFEYITLSSYVLDGIGLLGAMVLIRSITRFQYVIRE